MSRVLENKIFKDGDNIHRFSSQKDISGYNKAIVRDMIKYSPLSSGLLGASIVMFVLCLLTDIFTGRFSMNGISLQTLVMYGAGNAQLIKNGHEYYRLITPMVLHANFAHIFMNSLSLVLYLAPVQQRLKNKKLYAFVLFFGGMLGNCASVVVNTIKERNIVGVGASTSICSVIGFDLIYRILKVDGRQPNVRRILFILGYITLISLMPQVDFWGHFGSLIGGALAGLSFLPNNGLNWAQYRRNMLKLIGRIALVVYSVVLIIFAI